MTRDDAVKKVIAPDAGYDYEHALIDTLASLGLLQFDGPKLTLWKIIRKRGLSIETAQCICNDAYNAGLLSCPQESDQ